MRSAPRLLSILALVFAALAHAQDDLHLKIIALNDLHGNLQSPGTFRENPQSKSVQVGGVDLLAAYVAHLKSQNPNNIVVSAGDLTGASPLVSNLFHDEDTIETMNRIGLEINAVGNHEFDQGNRELQRKQHGGCSTQDSNTCKGASVGTPVPFEGAKFQYLAANVFDTATGKTIFPPYVIKSYEGIKIAFIGLTLKDTPTIVTPSGVAGLRFADEATTINTIVRKLRAQGIESFVVLIHQGGLQSGKGDLDINACIGGLKGTSIEPIINQLDDAVDLVLSAHTHQPYICTVPNRVGRAIPVTSASAYGRMLTDIDVTINRKTKDIIRVSAHNILVDRTNPDIKPDPAIAAIVNQYATLAAPIVNRVVGSISAPIPRDISPSGETAMGDLIADAQLEATSSPRSGGAVIAFINEGGIRTGLTFASKTPGVADGQVTYGVLFTAQPFANDLVTMTLTGAQIKTMLEEQFKGCTLGAPANNTDGPPDQRLLEGSAGFTYTWDPSAPLCNKIDPHSITLHNVPVSPTTTYRVSVNSLLADGGAQFYVLKQGTNRLVGPKDLDAMTAYFAKHPSVAPPNLNRIHMKPNPDNAK